MKQKMIASLLLLGVVMFLFLFPLFAHFLGEKGGVVGTQKGGIEPWFLEDEKSKTVLLYFGYVGCTSICIPTPNELSPLYQKIKSRNHDSAFYFVNLNTTQPSDWVEHSR
ncbi:MAG: SCO family protein [Sulfuricurvum sp.]|nr:SCO family protein [Sulfuricurvum sp.]